MKKALERIFADFLDRDLPEGVPRALSMTPFPGKALALIGMRRSGKTYLCYQRMRELLNDGVPKDRLLYINFEDDRLYGFHLRDFQTLLEVFYGQRPQKKSERCHLFFDEIQNVPDWERFVRRLLDTENVEVVITGSSARMLSLEIATSLRGRSLTREVFPYDFEEYLRANAFSLNTSLPSTRTRLRLQEESEHYCLRGGFPELQRAQPALRREILQSYVDAVVLKDVIERHRVSNVEALRAMLYQILSAPASKLSVNKLYQDLKSRGLKLTKDDLYDYLRYLSDAFLLFPVTIHARSEKKRQVNPRKIYLVDNGILDAYSTGQTRDLGARLENLVFLTLRRRGLYPDYGVTSSGYEIDFVYENNGHRELLQVSWALDSPVTREREIRSLREGMREWNSPRATLVTFSEEEENDDGIRIVPLWKFLTEDETAH